MRRQVGRAIGRGIVSPVVEGMDVNAILQQIDVQDLLENHVDINEVLKKVDVNELLERVDINDHLDRVDVDRLLSNVDLNALIQRSDFEAIIQKSYYGFFGQQTHIVRARLALCDQWVQRIGRCSCCYKEPWLPPRPGGNTKRNIVWPKNTLEFGVAVQFRCCGIISRFLAWVIDRIIIAVVMAIISWVTGKLMDDLDEKVVNSELPWIDYVFEMLLYICNVVYGTTFISCFGRTIGQASLGILVVKHDGRRVGICQSIMRCAFQPLNLLCFGWVVGLIRRDGKNWSDIFSCTAVVYAWNAKPVYKVDRRSNAFATSVQGYTLDDLDLDDSDSEGFRDAFDDTNDDPESRFGDSHRKVKFSQSRRK